MKRKNNRSYVNIERIKTIFLDKNLVELALDYRYVSVK